MTTSIASIVRDVSALPGVMLVKVLGEHPDPFIEIVITLHASADPVRVLQQARDWADGNRPAGGPLWHVMLGLGETHYIEAAAPERTRAGLLAAARTLLLPDGSPACPHGKRAISCGWCCGEDAYPRR